MQPRRNVVQHLIPWDTHVVSIQVENAALELSALGTAVHIPLEVDFKSREIIFYVVERLKALCHNGFNTCYP